MSDVARDSRDATANVSVMRAPVSFDNEQLILVDSNDEVVGYRNKAQTHQGRGTLHRAFSAFLFDQKGRLLVHRRSQQKPLWPGFWTNSCCSHPRRGESIDAAVTRRVREELGVDALAQSIYKFEYHAQYEDVGSEHELCHVYLARAISSSAQVSAHAAEVMDWRWLSVQDVDDWMASRPSELTPWFRQEWSALRGRYQSKLERFLNELGGTTGQRGAA
ncbi:isopentenyl-diphosphate Delta-isomerase [Congregibacter sp.]|uniref:isopentenyl-diphosphate Delta-isomerase n=1 Tax=Congregibacter sp. TaxID=2744308 RepID=UPI003F6A6FF1